MAVLAQASVEIGSFEVRDRVRDLPFVVTVHGRLETGEPLEDRVYRIAAPNEPIAAFTGIRCYEAEMERPN